MRSTFDEITVTTAGKFARRLTIRASRERVFDAIGTVDGPRRWWTPIVNGSAAAGEQLYFGFTRLDEQIVMRVDVVDRPNAVSWSCMAHTRGDEWTGTKLHFRLTERRGHNSKRSCSSARNGTCLQPASG
jgi:uncharacterized protein YndB with AHSA1/START domain